MKSIAVHIAAYQRQPVAKIAYAALDRLLNQFAEHGWRSTVYVAVSNAEDRRLAEAHGYQTLTIPNRPLGKKFDDLLRHIVLTNPGWDYLMEYGTDNILAPEYVDHVLEAIKAGHRHICINSFFITKASDHSKTRLFYKPAATSNIGRFTHRALIEATLAKHGYVFEHRLNRGLDEDSHARVKRAGRTATHFLPNRPPLLVDLKDEQSMHTYEGFARKAD